MCRSISFLQRQYCLLASAVVASLVPCAGDARATCYPASHRTANFITSAQDAKVAKMVGDLAEELRRDKAVEWLGKEMPTWDKPCHLNVAVRLEAPEGRTSFTFANNQVVGMEMEIKGPLDNLVAHVLPHEVTHTVFAHYFRCAVVRWADEGAACLSENTEQKTRHDHTVRSLVKQNKVFRLRTLFQMWEYPADTAGIMCLYAQGYAVADFLVGSKDRATFLAFVDQGMKTRDWDQAVKSHYGHESVDKLEEAWLQHLQTSEKARPAAFPPGAVEVRCGDGSVVKGILKDEKIDFVTDYGKLTIPVNDIHKIELGVRLSTDERKQIDSAIADLDHAEAKRRTAALDALLSLKEKAHAALVLAAQNKDAKAAARAEEALKQLRLKVAAATLEKCGVDVIYTKNSKIAGRVQAESLRLSTLAFGEQQLQLAGVRSLRSQAHAAAEAEERMVPVSPSTTLPPFPVAPPSPMTVPPLGAPPVVPPPMVSPFPAQSY